MSLQRSLALCPKKKCDKRVLTFWAFNHDVARFNLTKFTLVARPCLVTNPTFSQSTFGPQAFGQQANKLLQNAAT